MWEDPNVALHNDTNFGAEVSIFFGLSYRFLVMKNEISYVIRSQNTFV